LGPFIVATIIMLFAVFLFSIMGGIIKYLGTDYSPQQLSAFRNAFGLVPSCLVLLFSRSWHADGRPIIIRQWKLGLLRGAFVAVAQVLFYAALVHIEFATASTLVFAGPLFITALSVPVLRETVGLWRWIAVAIGFIGIVFIMQPGSEIFTLYALLPVGAAFCYACSSISVRLLDSNVPSAMLNIYSTTGALIGAIIILLTTTTYKPVASAHDWYWLITMGLVGGFAVLALISAYRLTRPSNLAPFEYFGIPFSFVIGWFAFAEAPFERLIPGALFIVAGGLLIVWREHLRQPARDDKEQPNDANKQRSAP
jgi:drug/metabolite transporter (DMT)-like permease